MRKKRVHANSCHRQNRVQPRRIMCAFLAGILTASFAAGSAAAYADTDTTTESVKADDTAEGTKESAAWEADAGTDPESAYAQNEPAEDSGETNNGTTENDFSSLELLIKTEDKEGLTGTVEGSYGDVYLVSYETEEEAEEAYAYYAREAQAVEVNENCFDVYPNSVSSSESEEDSGSKSTANNSETTSDDAAESSSSSQENALEILSDTDIDELSDLSDVDADSMIIALIDTGVSADCEVIDAVSVIDDNPEDEYGHGTKMYNTIVNRNPDAQILSIKAFGADGTTDAASIYAAIQYAIEAGADIINCSFSAASSESTSVVANALASAAASGIIVVGAAGNNGTNAADTIPGGIEEVYVFGSLADQSKKRYYTSNYGDTVDGYIASGSTSYAAAIASAYFAAGYSFDEMVEEEMVYTSYPGVTAVIEQESDSSESSEEEINLFGDLFVVADQIYNGGSVYLGSSVSLPLEHGDTYYYGSYSTTQTIITYKTIKKIAQTAVGYCLEPDKDSPPDGTYTFVALEGSSYTAKMTMAYILIYEVDELWDLYGDDAYPMVSSQYKAYAWCHALISYQYFGSEVLTGISSYESKVKSSASYVASLIYDSSELLYYYMESSVLYHYYSEDSYQDIVFLLWDEPEIPETGYLDILKVSANPTVTDGNSNYSMAGIQYTVYTNSSCTLVATDADGNNAVFTMDASGNADAIELDTGTYYVKESYNPSNSGYYTDSTVYTVTVSEDSTTWVNAQSGVTEEVKYGYIDVQKGSSNTAVTAQSSEILAASYFAGAEFTVYTDSACTTVATDWDGNDAVLTTDTYGQADALKMGIGTYYVKETSAPTNGRYVLDTTTYTVTVTAETTTWISNSSSWFLDSFTTGTLQLYKMPDNELAYNYEVYSFAGAEYTVYVDADCTQIAKDADGNDAIFTVNADGSANTLTLLTSTSADSSISPFYYYVKETKVPDCGLYEADEAVYTVTIAEDTITWVNGSPGATRTTDEGTVKETAKTFPCSLKKGSGFPVITNGNSCYSLAGAVYTVYTDATCTTVATDIYGEEAVFTTDENGETGTIYLFAGTYYVKETTAPPGYKLDTSVQTVTLGVDESAGETETVAFSFSDEPLTGSFDFSLSKLAMNTLLPTSRTGHTTAGAIFEVTFYGSDTAGENALAVWYFVTDENGQINIGTDSAFSGTYTDEDGVSHTVSSDSFYTLNGERVFPLGTYVIREVSAPQYYTLAGGLIFFENAISSASVTEGVQITLSEGTGANADTVVFSNYSAITAQDAPQKGKLHLVKASLSAAITEGNSCYSLAGAVYTVYLDAECTQIAEDYDGNDAILTTGSDGTSNTLDLEVNTYYVKETTASPGFELDETVYEVTITADCDIILSGSDSGTVLETPITIIPPLKLYKLDKDTGELLSWNGHSAAGAIFMVTFSGGAVWYFVTDENGEIDFATASTFSGTYTDANGNTCTVTSDDLYTLNGERVFPLGTYTITEISPPTDYKLEGSITLVGSDSSSTEVLSEGVTFTISEGTGEAQDTAVITLSGSGSSYTQAQFGNVSVQVYDKIKTGKIWLCKSSYSPETVVNNACYSVKGAVYTVYLDAECTQVAKDVDGNDAILTTGVDGTSNTLELEVNTYYVKETTASAGYELDETIYEVTVTEDCNLEVTDSAGQSLTEMPITVPPQIKLYKYDANSGISGGSQADAGLEGAIFEVTFYGNTNPSGSALAVWYFVTDENGEIDFQTAETWSGTYTDADGNSHTVVSDDLYVIDNSQVFPLGAYVIKEVSAPRYYQLSDTICFYESSFPLTDEAYDITEGVTFIISEGTGSYDDTALISLEGNSKTFTVEQFLKFSIYAFDEIQRGKITLTKLGDNREPLAGAVFTIVGETSGNVDEDSLSAYADSYDSVTVSGPDDNGITTITYTVTTDENGEVNLEGLLPMSYTITEISGVEGYTLLADNIEITLPLLLSDIEEYGARTDSDGVYYDNVAGDYCFYEVSYTINETASFEIPQAGNSKAGMLLTFMLPFFSSAGLFLVIRRRYAYVQT